MIPSTQLVQGLRCTTGLLFSSSWLVLVLSSPYYYYLCVALELITNNYPPCVRPPLERVPDLPMGVAWDEEVVAVGRAAGGNGSGSGGMGG